MNQIVDYLAESSGVPREKIFTILSLQKLYYLDYVRQSKETPEVEIPSCFDSTCIIKINRDTLDSTLELSNEFKVALKKSISGKTDHLKLAIDRRFSNRGKDIFRSIMDGGSE